MGKGKKGAGGAKGAKGAKSKTVEKKVKKVVEDKTFGLKNKNKSKKVQQYIAQVNQRVNKGKGEQQMRAEAAARKKAKEDQKQAEKDLFAMLGTGYAAPDTKKNRKKQKEEEEKKKQEALAKEKEEYERDFGEPISTLDQVFQVEQKSSVPRVCGELVHKDNLVSKTKDGVECVMVTISDGTTLKPIPVMMAGWNPSTFEPKVGCVLDIRSATAMVRGDRVVLELTKGGVATFTVASEKLTEHIIQLKEEQEELRAQGGIPIEELIEQQRAELKADDLIPVTKERFFEWKEKKKQKQQEEWEEKRKNAAKKGGKGLQVLSGKALFAYDPTLFKDDDAAFNNNDYDEEETGEETKKVENADSKPVADPKSAPDAADMAVVDGVAVKLQEDLYVGGDDDLDDLDDLED